MIHPSQSNVQGKSGSTLNPSLVMLQLTDEDDEDSIDELSLSLLLTSPVGSEGPLLLPELASEVGHNSQSDGLADSNPKPKKSAPEAVFIASRLVGSNQTIRTA